MGRKVESYLINITFNIIYAIIVLVFMFVLDQIKNLLMTTINTHLLPNIGQKHFIKLQQNQESKRYGNQKLKKYFT